jgi:flagellar basal-body rod modification protein FlgD
MADPISALGATAADTQSGKAKATLAADFDAFLLLLTTQLKHQDPLSPVEPTEFTSQLVQFASVEQQITANENLEKLVGIQNASLASSLIGFVGTDVEAEGAELPLQDKKGKFTYELPTNAKTVLITLTNANGDPVLMKTGKNTAGLQTFEWDGKNTSGVQQPDGSYRISVTAVGFKDETIPTKVKVFGHITGVSVANGTTVSAGDVEIPLDKIVRITEPDEL